MFARAAFRSETRVARKRDLYTGHYHYRNGINIDFLTNINNDWAVEEVNIFCAPISDAASNPSQPF